MRKFIQTHLLFLFSVLVFALLLFRNPFSQRTLIPNLEPFPDSFHYVVSAMSFIKREGFVIEREGRTITPSVPPLYSLALVPAFVTVRDVRAFYFVNVLLAFASLGLFYTIVNKLFKESSIRLFLLVLYVTCFPLSWFPELAMAENLILPLFLSGVLLLLVPITRKTIVIMSVLSVSFYATKYASLPLTFAFPILYLIKIVTQEKNKNKRIHSLIFYALFLIPTALLYVVYEFYAKKNNLIGGLIGLFFSVFIPTTRVEGTSTGANPFFSTANIATNVRAYVSWLLGDPLVILWRNVRILPKVLAIPAFIGLFTSKVGVQLLFLLTSVIAFMMVFYAYDGRYFIVAVPALFIGLGFFFQAVYKTVGKKTSHVLVSVVILLVLLGYLASIAKDVRFAVALNLKYAETPWYYKSIRIFDMYLHDHVTEFSSEPVIISALPPYLIDAYAHEEFIVLPLNASQEFRSNPVAAWGSYDFQNLQGEYARLLREGHPVFLTQYGLGNEKYLHNTFDAVRAKFKNTQVATGCFNLCNVYRLEL
ncbi:MAG TPA: hypothetical protein VLH19_00845 [Patescibacteria group bacterium]|nr:hypothetical protein [Patescibacteria group bacterium]